MLTVKDSTQTMLTIVSSLLWVAIVVISWIGNDFLSLIGLMLAACITTIYFIIGTSINGKIGTFAPLIFPIGISFILWIVSFICAYTFQGYTDPGSFILGFHPGQFWIMAIFWIGSFIVLGYSYAVYFDKYILTDESWNEFIKEIEYIKANLDSDYME